MTVSIWIPLETEKGFVRAKLDEDGNYFVVTAELHRTGIPGFTRKFFDSFESPALALAAMSEHVNTYWDGPVL
jgi:phosphoribosylpyrophosphate synthetase